MDSGTFCPSSEVDDGLIGTNMSTMALTMCICTLEVSFEYWLG